MKANQKFVNRDDEAVSPVIAVILMVAITVVLAATVYVWVSGFGSSSGSAAKSISLTSAAALDTTNSIKGYTVASATAGMKYSDFSATVNGAAWGYDTTAGACTTPTPAASSFIVCRGAANPLANTNVVQAGDILYFKTVSSGQTLRLLDTNANSVLATLTIG